MSGVILKNIRFIRAFFLFVILLSGASSLFSQEVSNSLDDQSFCIRTEWFDRGNVTPGGPTYSDLYVCLCTGGQDPTFVEFDVDFPEAGDYELWGLYSANESRPLDFQLDGQFIAKTFDKPTGSWMTSQAKWVKQTDFSVASKGKHVVRFETRTIHIPHICALKFIPKSKLTTDWVIPRPLAKERIQSMSDWQPSPWSGGWYHEIARDRAQKKESGETFSNHFGLETSIALVCREAVSFEVSPESFQKLDLSKVKLNDELTYLNGMFDESEKETTAAISDPESTNQSDEPDNSTVFVKVKVDRTKSSYLSSIPEEQYFEFSLPKYQEILRRTDEMIQDFRDELGEDDYLAANEEELQKFLELGQTFADQAKQLFQSEPFSSGTSEGTSEASQNVSDAANDAFQNWASPFAEAYLDVIRLYSRTAMENPLLDFEKILFIKRKASDLGLPQNYQSNCVLNRDGFDDKLMTLALPKSELRDSDGFQRKADDLKNMAEMNELVSATNQNLPIIETLFAPDYPTFLGDLDLHFDGQKALVSSISREKNWNVFELDLEGIKEQKSTDEVMKAKLPVFPDADNYDACYLPDESVIFESTGCYIAVPCVMGTTRVTNSFRLNKDGSIRRLTFDQEHNWCPTVMPDGRILYLRWEYTDIPHVPGRLLFQMNPDGTSQTSYYGTNSLWPVSMLYARPIPGSTTKFVTIVTGHHGVSRMGEMILFDVQQGRHENEGAVERICGYPKKVESRTDPKYYSTLTGDNIVDESWPKFLHPYPLSENYFLCAAQPNREALWGLYLVDRKDNMILLAENNDFACFEPVPWRETERPPVIMDRVDLSKEDATVYIADLYFGDGLKGVPRNTVKNLRLYSYNYLYPQIGGMNAIVGTDGPWDVRQIVGTVPVNEDGSVMFKVPANVPIAIQPLDENGEAMQQMRSWFTAMPGEFLSCTGCHEDQNSTSPPSNKTFQSDAEIPEIRPWFGPMRGFSFNREVQPVLDHYCVACHDGQEKGWGVIPFDLRGGKVVSDYKTAFLTGQPNVGNFSSSYLNLHQFVRRPGLESDYKLLNPMEFSANTTELVQILRDGHHGLQLDAEAWDRIITWVDMNAPYHGSWTEYAGKEYVEKWNDHRKDLMKLYANVDDESETARGTLYDPERAGKLLKTDHSILPVNRFASDFERQILKEVSEGKRSFPSGEELKQRFDNEMRLIHSDAESQKKFVEKLAGKPVSIGCESPNRYEWSRKAEKSDDPNIMGRTEAEAIACLNDEQKQKNPILEIELAPDVPLFLTKVPSGSLPKESIENASESAEDNSTFQSFWVGTFEITNEQFELFDPDHDSRVESRLGLSHGIRGFFVNAPELPVCRVSWNEAVAFCDWLSVKTGKKFRLPTENEWEYVCRAETQTPFSFGDWGTDFSKDANLADQMLIEFIIDQYYCDRRPLPATYYDDWIPKERRFCDNGFLSERPGQYRPNPWGIFDLHGNLAEWTATSLTSQTGIELLDSLESEKIVRGGSWHDRPYRATSSFRTSYRPWQRVFDVGFRVVCEDE
ncbi:MAG: SUMF1/EgtB/PvdO family nonheme iron enzyme [Planctomycetia bacterium]|nr:SUMF1/EgtB/PvdO family nonheme iron enzyme [Planctomycetia bacterium]